MRVCVNIIECCIVYFILYNIISNFTRFFFAVILNPNDFDFLLSRGNSSGQINPRDSILERFDPISGRKSVAPSVLINRLEPSVAAETTTATTTHAAAAEAATPIVTSHSISTIREVDSFLESSPSSNRADDQLISIKQSPVTNQCASTIAERKNSSSKSANTIANKLASAEKTELSNSVSIISGDGDNSQASSTTETYETASVGEPLKVSYLSLFDDSN